MNLNDFRQNKQYTADLKNFLASETGRVLREAMREESPARKIAFGSRTARGMIAQAAAETATGGSSETLLGVITGFEAALIALFDDAPEYQPKAVPRQSTKAGAVKTDFSPADRFPVP